MEFRPAWAASGSPGFFARPCGEISPRIRQLTRDLAADMMARPECRDAHEALLSDLMIAVIERFTPWRSFSSSVRAMDTLPRPDWRIRRVAETIRTDVSRNFDVNVLAKQAGLSRAHFFRLFESSIGVPPRVYLNVMRLERAVDAVVNENGNIGDIGKGLGFDVPAHFTRFFSSHTGVNPRQFRAVSRLAS
jgi:transcriptional regulator GlxA family with amidase domain